MLGIILSIIFPGLGQIYHEKYLKGAIMALLALTPLYPVALIWSIIDVIKIQKALGKGISSKEAAWIVVSVLIIAPIFVGLIGTATYQGIDYLNRTKYNPERTREELIEIRLALESYKDVNGEYPKDLYKLIKGKPLRKDWLLDGWGNFYRLEKTGDNMIITSAGNDGKFDTEDDIAY